MRRLLLALALTLAFPAGASAYTGERIAGAAWPDSPCAGRVVVHYNAGAELDAAYPDGVWVDGSHGEAPDGMADADCQIYMRDPERPHDEDQCGELVHEFGHEAGRDHQSPENDGIMHLGYPDLGPTPTYHDCWKVALQSPFRAASQAIDWSHPCKLVHTSVARKTYSCVAYRVTVDLVSLDGQTWASGVDSVDDQKLKRAKRIERPSHRHPSVV